MCAVTTLGSNNSALIHNDGDITGAEIRALKILQHVDEWWREYYSVLMNSDRDITVKSCITNQQWLGILQCGDQQWLGILQCADTNSNGDTETTVMEILQYSATSVRWYTDFIVRDKTILTEIVILSNSLSIQDDVSHTQHSDVNVNVCWHCAGEITG